MNNALGKIATTIRTVLVDFPEIQVATVFGSAACNRLRSDSDIDIAVAASAPLSSEKTRALKEALFLALEREIDLIDLCRVNGFILTEALAHGQTILNKSSETLRVLMRKLWYWNADFAPLVRQALDRKARRFIYGT